MYVIPLEMSIAKWEMRVWGEILSELLLLLLLLLLLKLRGWKTAATEVSRGREKR